MSIEHYEQKNTEQWSTEEWIHAVKDADVEQKLPPFNDVIAGAGPVSDELKKHLVLKNVYLGDKLCDIYHWDQKDGKKRRNFPILRVFVHIKEG